MKNRVVKFRTSIGGFDRRDVLGYIKKLAEERNELLLRLEERRIQEEQPLRNAYRQNAKEFKNAEDLLRALEIKHEEIGRQIRSLRERLESAAAEK